MRCKYCQTKKKENPKVFKGKPIVQIHEIHEAILVSAAVWSQNKDVAEFKIFHPDQKLFIVESLQTPDESKTVRL